MQRFVKALPHECNQHSAARRRAIKNGEPLEQITAVPLVAVVGGAAPSRHVRDHHAKARVREWNLTKYVWSVRGWKAMRSKELRGHKLETATWKINWTVPHGHRICAEVAGHEERIPYGTIKP